MKISKNNIQKKIHKIEDTRKHYSIRKLTVGIASVLVGVSFLRGGFVVQGDTVSGNEEVSSSEVVKTETGTANIVDITDEENVETSSVSDPATNEIEKTENVENINNSEQTEQVTQNSELSQEDTLSDSQVEQNNELSQNKSNKGEG